MTVTNFMSLRNAFATMPAGIPLLVCCNNFWFNSENIPHPVLPNALRYLSFQERLVFWKISKVCRRIDFDEDRIGPKVFKNGDAHNA